MERFGLEYVTDLWIQNIKRFDRDKAFRVYVTDIMQAMLVLKTNGDIPRFLDILEPKQNEQPEETADDIISNISEKLNRLGGK